MKSILVQQQRYIVNVNKKDKNLYYIYHIVGKI